MVRPRYLDGEKKAVDKIEAAFWECLEEAPFDEMTVAGIVRKAGLNRNTFYYHYQDIDHMAQTIVGERLLDPALPAIVLSQIAQGRESLSPDALLQSDFSRRLNHVRLIAGEHSSATLRSMLKDSAKRIWCTELGIDEDELDAQEDLLLEFTLGGLLAMLAKLPADADGLGPKLLADPRMRALARENYERLRSFSRA